MEAEDGDDAEESARAVADSDDEDEGLSARLRAGLQPSRGETRPDTYGKGHPPSGKGSGRKKKKAPAAGKSAVGYSGEGTRDAGVATVGRKSA